MTSPVIPRASPRKLLAVVKTKAKAAPKAGTGGGPVQARLSAALAALEQVSTARDAANLARYERVTPALMDQWCRDFDNWAVCDTLCFHLFDRVPHAWSKIRKMEQRTRRVREAHVLRAHGQHRRARQRRARCAVSRGPGAH
jgi:hypothetical protein